MLCHISELSEERVEKPEDVVQLGQEMEFKILRIDNESKKIGLSARAVGKDEPVVDATGSHPVLVRAGAIPWDRVLEFLD